MTMIQQIPFYSDTPSKLKNVKYGENWPVVYIINNENEAYVGETVNAAIRTSQHLKNPDRQRLNNISLISDDNFNKSVILDLEAFLIGYMSADGKYQLQNSTMGMQLHNYYGKAEYQRTFNQIWNDIKEQGLATNTISYIENSDIFKYSPYKSLSLDQYRVVDSLVEDLVEAYNLNKNITTIVQGGAGTGKTVLAIYLMKLLSEANLHTLPLDKELDPGLSYVIDNLSKLPKMKIGLVVPMQSLRATIKKVFKGIRGLNATMVISPIQVPKSQFDLLIVDEAHRLRQRKALSQYPVFDNNNKSLGLDNSGTELDWILKCSKNQVFFYDNMQSIKPSDVDKEQFDELMRREEIKIYSLDSQFRCKGGNDYINYIKAVLKENQICKVDFFGKYDLKLFDNIENFIDAIKNNEQTYGLCRIVAGYSWKWQSKKDKNIKDINIDGIELQWNTVNEDWVNSPNSIDEVGCIHTIQGYDLNYTGVIFGNEIKYDTNKGIYIDKSQYFDLQGKTALKNEDTLKNYIINIYMTLMTRGIKGTYVYACDKGLREYLRQFI